MYVAEILIDHPRLSVIDQVEDLYKRHLISIAEYTPLTRAIYEKRHVLDDPTNGAFGIPRRLAARFA